MKARVTLRHDVSRELTLESLIEELLSNKCIYCLQNGIKNGNYIDAQWRDLNINRCWPRPYQESDIIPHAVKGIVVGQDPTIDNPRLLEYVRWSPSLGQDRGNIKSGSRYPQGVWC